MQLILISALLDIHALLPPPPTELLHPFSLLCNFPTPPKGKIYQEALGQRAPSPPGPRGPSPTSELCGQAGHHGLLPPLCAQFDLLQDSDCDNDKQAAGQRADGNHEENIPIQVFCLTFVTLHQREPFGYNCTVQQICDLMISTTDLCSSLETKTYSTLWFADICTIQPKSSQSSPQHSSLLGVPHQGVCVLFTNADGVLTS